MLGTVRHRADPTFHYSWVRVEPALTLKDGPPSRELALGEAWEDSHIDRLADEWIPV